MSPKKVLFVVSEDWYFFTHRFYLAKAAIRLGYSVALLSNCSRHRSEIENAGIKVFNWSIERSSKNVIKEFTSVKNIVLIIQKFKPDLVFAVAIKPVLYSAVACIITRIKPRIFTLAGLNIFVSIKSNFLLKTLLNFIVRVLFIGEKTRIIIQNPEDKLALISSNLINKKKINLILGAGVDMKSFYYKRIPNENIPIVMLSARMLWSKGIIDFIESARLIKNRDINAKFVLVGSPDNQNSDAVPLDKLKKWNESGLIEWWGYQENMVKVYHQASIVCLPTTYGEGLPKSLLEAASCGRPIVTYDVPGCREIVKDQYNGFLVEQKNVDQLVNSISALINNKNLCEKMGRNGRKLVKEFFTQEKIANDTLKVWANVLSC